MMKTFIQIRVEFLFIFLSSFGSIPSIDTYGFFFFTKVKKLLGKCQSESITRASLALYEQASSYALERGIIIADTKFEFGVDSNGVLHLADEVLTPGKKRLHITLFYSKAGLVRIVSSPLKLQYVHS